MRALRPVFVQLEAALVERQQLLVIAARRGQRLEHVERAFPRLGAVEQLAEGGARRRVLRIALEGIPEGGEGALRVVERGESQRAERGEVLRLAAGLGRELGLPGQHLRELVVVPQLAQQGLERGEDGRLVTGKGASLAQEIGGPAWALRRVTELLVVQLRQAHRERELHEASNVASMRAS